MLNIRAVKIIRHFFYRITATPIAFLFSLLAVSFAGESKVIRVYDDDTLLLIGLAKYGHKVRSLAPITAEACRSGDAFAVSHPEIAVTRFLLPYFETAPDIPPPDEYRRLEREQIEKKLSLLIADERPHILIIGRETFAWHVPEIAKAYSLPCMLRIAGATTLGILNRTHSKTLGRRLLEQYRKVNLIVTPAKHLAERLQPLGFDNIKVIPNAIDLHQFSPRPKDDALLRELGFRDDDIIVIHVSNLKTLKRPLDVVYSAAESLKHNPKLVYVIVGDGPCRANMQDASRQKHIAENFRFVGWVDYHRVPGFINLADMVVMPAEAETQARVYLETQACGRLLLASDIPGAREVIVDGETGLLFRKGDIADLTARTLLAAGDPQLRTDIGRRAQERVRVHSLDDAVAAYAAALEAVLQ
jgi:glycosyltransferase involved in cell wall biosynthesis